MSETRPHDTHGILPVGVGTRYPTLDALVTDEHLPSCAVHWKSTEGERAPCDCGANAPKGT